MQEIFEKIIEKLEAAKKCGTKHYEDGKYIYTSPNYDHETLNKATEIVKQAAAECKNGHFGCNSNGERERCNGCGLTDCKNRNTIWFGVSDDNNGWIPCSERLPDKYKHVLVCTDNGGYYIAHLNKRTKWVCTAECVSTVIENSDVIAWQPLPAPYNQHICTNNDCTFNEGKDCPAAEGCAGYERKRTNFDMCCESMEAMAQIIEIAKIGWTKEQIMEWLQKEVCEVPE